MAAIPAVRSKFQVQIAPGGATYHFTNHTSIKKPPEHASTRVAEILAAVPDFDAEHSTYRAAN